MYLDAHPRTQRTTNAPMSEGVRHWEGKWWVEIGLHNLGGPEMSLERWRLRPDLTYRHKQTETRRYKHPFPPHALLGSILQYKAPSANVVVI